MYIYFVIILGLVLSVFIGIKARTLLLKVFSALYIIFFLALGLLKFKLVNPSVGFYLSFVISLLLFIFSYKKVLGAQFLNILFTGVLFLTFVWRFLELAYFGYLIICEMSLIIILPFIITKSIISHKKNTHHYKFPIITCLIFLIDIINFLISQ